MMYRRTLLALALSSAFSTALFAPAANAVGLIAKGSLSGALSDASGLTGTLENGVAANLLGGLGSGLAWAGGDTFLALPDRGPNATAWNSGVDDTSSYIARFSTVQLGLTASAGGALPYTLTPTLSGTTLLSSTTPLHYGAVTPSLNTAGQYYFSGRSDNFVAGSSTNPDNGRLDPEGIRLSRDGRSVFVSDEYGPYVYQFDRSSGQRIRTYTLPAAFAASTLSAQGSVEIGANTVGRVANKGMEGLAITPDGTKLVGFMQSPLAQDGGDGKRVNRMVTIDIATGATQQFAYDNRIGTKNYGSSEILALNDHQFLVLERDGKGLGDGSNAAIKQLYMVDLNGAQDITGLSGEATLLAAAPSKTLFLDIRAALNAAGISDALIPAKLEGLAFGQDLVIGGVNHHTLYVANDNDFLSSVGGVSNPNQWFVFSVTDAELSAMGASYTPQAIAAVPEPGSVALMLAGAFGLAGMVRRRRNAA